MKMAHLLDATTTSIITKDETIGKAVSPVSSSWQTCTQSSSFP
ncbi:unnamed protein product [Pylaiella littoralis]